MARGIRRKSGTMKATATSYGCTRVTNVKMRVFLFRSFKFWSKALQILSFAFSPFFYVFQAKPPFTNLISLDIFFRFQILSSWLRLVHGIMAVRGSHVPFTSTNLWKSSSERRLWWEASTGGDWCATVAAVPECFLRSSTGGMFE